MCIYRENIEIVIFSRYNLIIIIKKKSNNIYIGSLIMIIGLLSLFLQLLNILYTKYYFLSVYSNIGMRYLVIILVITG